MDKIDLEYRGYNKCTLISGEYKLFEGISNMWVQVFTGSLLIQHVHLEFEMRGLM